MSRHGRFRWPLLLWQPRCPSAGHRIQVQEQDVSRWAEQGGYNRYLEPSIQGSTEADWSTPRHGARSWRRSWPPTGMARVAGSWPKPNGSWSPRCPNHPAAGTSPNRLSPSTWEPAAVPVRPERARPVSTARGTTGTDTGSGFRAGPCVFAGAVCDGCSLQPQCLQAAPGRGHRVSLHPREGLLQEAWALQASPAHAPYRAWHQVAEHRLARLVQLGLRQTRYRGRVPGPKPNSC